MNDDSDVEVLEEAPALRVRSDSEEHLRQERKWRRRKIRRLVQRAKGYPSFLSLLTVNYDNSDDEIEGIETDPYLVPSAAFVEPVASSQTVKIAQPKRLRIDVNAKLGLKEGVAIKMEDGDMMDHFPDVVSSAFPHHHDEGWYEGVIPMPMPEDGHFLPPLQAWIRRQFEFFSATVEDASLLQAGRRPVTIGRVGIRCIHCRLARQSANDLWPVGAVSYPANLNALYTMCSQKLPLHFEQNCRSAPEDVRQELEMIQQAERSTKRARGGISASLYYVVAAKRRGVTDTEDGMRFERDLSLDPLPLDTIRQQHQQVQQTADTEDFDEPASSAMVQPQRVTSSAVAPTSRITADEGSERVLAQAISESDDGYLCNAEQKSLVTDFMFLTIRQMKLCNALPSDLSSRGKKSKMVRLGLAGYCCRHCANTIEGCRSYPSAADNMVSSISNSFSLHIQKCGYTPDAIKRAVAVYKRLHTRQMAQLPYGSQRKFIHELWERLRAEDKTEEEMAPIIANLPVEPLLPPQPIFSAAPKATASRCVGVTPAQANVYPTVDDDEAREIVEAAVNDWDPAVNDFLIRPEDRNLVSDYVFLAMRQLRAIGPNNTARSRLVGLSCIHCQDREHQAPSGRSYPSAPDNYASALNTSYYNHFQNCAYVPVDLKRALAATRKIHSIQCSSLQFGSQRKYFNRLFERLQTFDLSTFLSEGETTDAFKACAFINVSTKQQSCWLCQKCSGVPISFRVPGSVWFQKPDPISISQHQQHCQRGKWDLSHAGTLLEEGIEGHCDKSRVLDGALKSFLQTLLGENSDVVATLTNGLESFLRSGSGTVDAPFTWLVSTEINFVPLQSAFESFANTSLWKGSRRLVDLQKFCVFLQFLFPLLEIPVGDEIKITAKESCTELLNEVLNPVGKYENHDDEDEAIDDDDVRCKRFETCSFATQEDKEDSCSTASREVEEDSFSFASQY